MNAPSSNSLWVFFISVFFYNQAIKAQVNVTHNLNKPQRIIYACNDTLRSDKSNSIAIVVSKNLRENINVETSQGRLYSRDNQLFLLDSLRNGNVMISVFKLENSQRVLLEKRKFAVAKSKGQIEFDQLNINPGINLCGYFGGKIPLDTIKNANKLSIKSEYKIISCVLYVTSSKSEYSEPLIKFLDSGLFDNDILKLFKLLKPGVMVAFDEIKFVDKNGRLIVYPKLIAFNVIEN